jgi:hypothetical protein
VHHVTGKLQKDNYIWRKLYRTLYKPPNVTVTTAPTLR